MPSTSCAGTNGGSILGDRPIQSWNPENPVEALTVFMILNLIRGMARTQPFWFLSTWYHTAWFTVLLEHSDEPSVSGWYDKERFRWTPVSLCRAHQNFKMKSLSLSDTMSVGNPFSQYQLLKNIVANFSAVISV